MATSLGRRYGLQEHTSATLIHALVEELAVLTLTARIKPPVEALGHYVRFTEHARQAPATPHAIAYHAKTENSIRVVEATLQGRVSTCPLARAMQMNALIQHVPVNFPPEAM
jgi:hypothetical protein